MRSFSSLLLVCKVVVSDDDSAAPPPYDIVLELSRTASHEFTTPSPSCPYSVSELIKPDPSLFTDDLLLGRPCDSLRGKREGDIGIGWIEGLTGFKEGDVLGNFSCPNGLMLSSKILCNRSNDKTLESELWLEVLGLEVVLPSASSVNTAGLFSLEDCLWDFRAARFAFSACSHSATSERSLSC